MKNKIGDIRNQPQNRKWLKINKKLYDGKKVEKM